jgi:hypothetical protein
MVFVALTANLPSGVFEQARFMFDEEHIRLFIANLCETCDYYPKKPDQNQKSPAKEIKISRDSANCGTYVVVKQVTVVAAPNQYFKFN